MYRVVKLGRFYAKKVDFDEDIENIREFVESGDVVILCVELEELEDYGIELEDIEVIE